MSTTELDFREYGEFVVRNGIIQMYFRGTQAILRFRNGYGCSIIQHDQSYGNEYGLYELAVIKFTSDRWGITYDTPITDDVLGSLPTERIMELLPEIYSLPASVVEETNE